MSISGGNILFDQFSRYRACADLLEQLSSQGEILDVGSGPECHLGRILPERNITFVDPLIDDEKIENKIIGNIFDPKLDGEKFGYVCSVDTLEHIPESVRNDFLDRITSLAEKGIVLGFPCSDDDVAHLVDKGIADSYERIFDKGYSWLDEHFAYPLPNREDVAKKFRQQGWNVSMIGHGHAPWLTKLLEVVICSWENTGTHDKILEINKRFNETLYHYDFTPPFYRWFLVATKEQELPITYKPELVIDDEVEKQFNDILKQTSGVSYAVGARLGAERDKLATERDKLAAERKHLQGVIVAMEGSTSWRLTRPIRKIKLMLSKNNLTYTTPHTGFRDLLRKIFSKAPLPATVKNQLRKLYYRILNTGPSSIKNSIFSSLAFAPPTEKPAPQKSTIPDYIVWGVIDWHFRFQRPQQLAQAIAMEDRRVFYISVLLKDDGRPGFDIEPLGSGGRLFQVKLYAKGAPGVYQSGPTIETVLQLRSSIGYLLEWADSRQIVNVAQHPFWFNVASALPNSKMVYDCMDHHEGFGNVSETILALEQALISNADLTVTTSDFLDQAVSEHTDNRTIIRNGCDFDHFSNIPENVYVDEKNRPVIGYFGAIAEWFDQQLIEVVASRFSDCKILLIGADTVQAEKKLGSLPNVEFLGEAKYEKLPYYLHGFSVCMLPFKITPLTSATNPVKVYEYLSAGKPVVTVDLPEMKQFGGMVEVASSIENFTDMIGQALVDGNNKSAIERRQQFAKKQTWQVRARELLGKVEAHTPDEKVSVVVVTYNNLELTTECLKSLTEKSDYDATQIIVVDNNSTDGSKEFLAAWVEQGADRKITLNDDNRGFAAANNQGAAIADGEYLVFLNNDTYVTHGWVRTLMRHLKRDKSIGLIGPVTNNIGNEAKINITYENMDEMSIAANHYTRHHIGQILPLNTAAFFCVMLRRGVFDKVGRLDEAFGRGFFEDDDYCRRIEKIGLRVVCAEDVFIHHHLSASFDQLDNKERKELFEQNKATYEAKWGKWIPHTNQRESKPAPESFKGSSYFMGRCNICGNESRFFYKESALWRESLNCEHCLSTSRYRSLARGTLMAINELTGIDSASLAGLSSFKGSRRRLRVYDTQPPFYFANCAYPLPDLLKSCNWIDVELSQFKPGRKPGETITPGVTNQNLESLTFGDDSLDIVITSDVMEHVRLDDKAHSDIYRVLRPGGIYLFTVPHVWEWEETLVRVKVDPSDPAKDEHLLEPEYHGDTNNEEGKGVLAYRTYGRDIETTLLNIGFEVEYSRENFNETGIMTTELFYCRK